MADPLEQTREEKQYQKMTQTPIPPLVVSLAIPTIISMLVTAIYNMADTFFVGKLGTSATAAVGIVFSLMALIQAVGFTLGMGSGSTISRLLGEQQYDKADTVSSTGFFTAIFFGLLVSIFGELFITQLMHALGSTATILPYAQDYARYILLGAPVMSGSFVLNNLLRSEGKASLAMIGITFGGILNIALDPVFIFLFHMGIAGAAIATLISQCISFCILLSCFLLKKSVLHLSVRHISRRFGTYSVIVRIGFPSLCRQGLASIATVALNIKASAYGDPAVAAMSVVGRIFMIVIAVMIGFGQGYMPVLGFNYGAKKYTRMKEAFLFSLRTGILMMSVLAVGGFLLAPELMGVFRRGDAEVIRIGTFAIRAQSLVLPFFPLFTLTNMTYQVLGRSWQATLIASYRQGVFFLPLILSLPSFLGLKGIQITQPLADLFSVPFCIPFLLPLRREINSLIRRQ